MTIQGLRDTTNFVTDQRPKNWREGILLLQPNGSAPLTALTSLMKKRVVTDPEFNWWEKALPTRRIQIDEDAILADDATAITVIAGALQLKVGDLLFLEETGEVALVTVDPTVDTIIPTVTRDFPVLGNGAAIDTDAAGVNPFLFIMGSIYEEGSDAPTGINYDVTKVFNFTQIFRNTLEITRTAANTKLRTGDAVREARREALELHSIDIEKSLFFGAKIETTQGGKPIRQMDGALRFIDAGNIINHAGATVSLAELEGWLEQAFRFGSSQKMAFTGNIGMLTIQQAIRRNTTYRIITGEREFGMNMTRIITPFGELLLKVHPLFNQLVGGVTTAVAYNSINSWLWILDMDQFWFTHLQGGDTQFQKKLQSNGLDSEKSGYLSELSMEVHHPLAHFLVKNMGAGAADA